MAEKAATVEAEEHPEKAIKRPGVQSPLDLPMAIQA